MLTISGFELLGINFSEFTTQLWPLVIVRILFSLNILPVKEITLHVKPIPKMCLMLGSGGRWCWGGGGRDLISTDVSF